MKRHILLAVAACTTVFGYTPTNIPAPYDHSFSECAWNQKQHFSLGVRGQHFAEARSYDSLENSVAPTAIYGSRESALAMLEGARPGTELHGLANQLRGMQDGDRGTFSVEGDFVWQAALLDMLFHLPLASLPGHLSLGIHIPFISAGYSNSSWKSNTATRTGGDEAVSRLFVDDQASLDAFTQKHGNLSLHADRKVGLGDASAVLYWQMYFAQHQRRLREVMVQLRAGVQVPTGMSHDINKAFDVDFGRDGAVCLPLGATLRLDLSGGVRVGADITHTTILRRTKQWRLKTGWSQTPHLQLAIGEATREYGPEWRLTLFSQVYSRAFGVVLTGGYQFFKHTDSMLYPQDDEVSAQMINTSATVDASESHNMIIAGSFTPPQLYRSRMKPEFTAQLLVPFNGKMIASGYVVSGGVSIKF